MRGGTRPPSVKESGGVQRDAAAIEAPSDEVSDNRESPPNAAPSDALRVASGACKIARPRPVKFVMCSDA